MEIKELQDSEITEFESFKATEWKIADQEHYGNQPPNFDKYTFTLVAKQEAIVGQVEVEVCQGVARVTSLLVSNNHQGQGVGSQLMAAAEQKAKELGAHKISLETGINWAAKAFYEKQGYQVRTVLPNDVAHQDFVLMDKMLSD
jgi:ribosomal protein S18 acetylase RimI-like enzyme